MESHLIYDCVERLSEILRQDSRQAGAAHGLQPVQIEVLHYLSICNRYSDTPMAVTEYLGQTKGTVSQTLKVLENKEFISKCVDKNDKRVNHLKVSAKGRRLLKQTIPTSMFSNACNALADEKQSDIATSLQQLLGALVRANKLKTFGVCSTCRFNQKIKGGAYFFCDFLQERLSKVEVQLICKEHELSATQAM